MKNSGDFGDPFGEDSSQGRNRDLGKMIRALEKLEASTGTMDKTALYDLQRRIGTAVRDLQLEVMKQINARNAVDAFGDPIRKS